jgi:hypothetical protein
MSASPEGDSFLVSLDPVDYCFTSLATDPISLSPFPANLSCSDAELAAVTKRVNELRAEVDHIEQENQASDQNNKKIIRRLTEARDTIKRALGRLSKYDERFPAFEPDASSSDDSEPCAPRAESPPFAVGYAHPPPFVPGGGHSRFPGLDDADPGYPGAFAPRGAPPAFQVYGGIQGRSLDDAFDDAF